MNAKKVEAEERLFELAVLGDLARTAAADTSEVPAAWLRVFGAVVTRLAHEASGLLGDLRD